MTQVNSLVSANFDCLPYEKSTRRLVPLLLIVFLGNFEHKSTLLDHYCYIYLWTRNRHTVIHTWYQVADVEGKKGKAKGRA